MLKKFVYWTGASDFLVGAGTWAGAIMNPQMDQFVPLITLGTFLMMAAACLMWASHDMKDRAPVIFWQGLVRISAVIAVIVAVPNGWSAGWTYALLAIDGPIGLTYIIGSMRVTGLSPFALLQCKPPMATA